MRSDAGGTPKTNLTNHPAQDFLAVPGPTGKIAFTSNRAGSYDVYVMDPDGGNVTPLTDDPAGDLAPDWSPDGSRIAFTSSRDGNSEIYVMDADGSDETRAHSDPDGERSRPGMVPRRATDRVHAAGRVLRLHGLGLDQQDQRRWDAGARRCSLQTAPITQ